MVGETTWPGVFRYFGEALYLSTEDLAKTNRADLSQKPWD